jgi:hypothetical protein
MTLDELNKIERDRSGAEMRARSLKEAEQYFATLRNGDKELVEIIYELNKNRQYGSWHEERAKFLNAAVNRFKIEIMRLAELQFEAEARGQTSRALILKTQLDAFLNEPTKETT